jgi:hypothetical protein
MESVGNYKQFSVASEEPSYGILPGLSLQRGVGSKDSVCASQIGTIKMEGVVKMTAPGPKVLFIAGFGPIDRDLAQSRALYADSLGILFSEEAGGYLHTGDLQGTKHFALWPLSQAAQSCFGSDSWPDNIPVPQAWLEFEVDDLEKVTTDLELRGNRMLVKNKTEPWGQTVSRFLSPEGLLIGITLTPALREKN